MTKIEEKHSESTEQRIINAARKVFYTKGLAGSRMQEIADIAGINKALLHYYFRTKEKLFFEILKQTAGDFFPGLIHIWNSNDSFEEKLRKFIHSYIDFLLENMYLPQFIITLVYQNPEKIVSVMRIRDIVKISNLQKHIDTEAENGKIKNVDAYQLMISILSLCVFPVMARPIMKLAFEYSDADYQKILNERKNIVYDTIMGWLTNEDKKNMELL